MPAGRSCLWWGGYVYPFGAVLDHSARRVARVRFTACLAELQRKVPIRTYGFESRLAHRDIVAIATFVGGRVSHVPIPVPTGQIGDSKMTQAAAKATREAKERAALEAHVQRVVAAAPPLTEAQADQIAALLMGRRPGDPPSAYEIAERQRRAEDARLLEEAKAEARKMADAITACDVCNVPLDRHHFNRHCERWVPGRAERLRALGQL